jgi:fido (protein-threonine AMPylation protein)
MESLGEFELFLHDTKAPLPILVKAALAHVQFETIHPFLDGNGRRWWRNSGMLLNSVLTIEWADQLGMPRLA